MMAQFELGGSVSVDQTFQSSFAQELVKECSISCNESAYKSSFATELLESSVSHNNSGAKISEEKCEEKCEENIYENVKSPLSMESNLFLDDTTDFRRCSQIFNSTMVGSCSSPRESLSSSSISRVQTVVSIAGQSSLTILDDSLSAQAEPVTANFNKLQHELEVLQAKLNDMERSRVTYETTNQQLLSLVNKLSSQLSRNVKTSQHSKTNSSTEAQPTTQKTAAATTVSGISSSFRRQKAIRIKKRDSVRRRVSMKGDTSSYTSSDSGNYSDDIDETNNLHRLLRRGLHLVNNVNQELESVKDHDKLLEKNQTLKSSLSSSISRLDNSKKVVIKIENRGGPGVGEVVGEAEVERRETQAGKSPAVAPCHREIHTNGRGTVFVPVPFFV